MVKFYVCPSRRPPDGRSLDYAGGRQADSVLSATRWQQVTDGLSNTMLLGERWAHADGRLPPRPMPPLLGYSTDPGDAVVNDTAAPDGQVPVPPPPALFHGFGTRQEGAVNVGLCDGSVRRFACGRPGFTALVGRNDGQVVALD